MVGTLAAAVLGSWPSRWQEGPRPHPKAGAPASKPTRATPGQLFGEDPSAGPPAAGTWSALERLRESARGGPSLFVTSSPSRLLVCCSELIRRPALRGGATEGENAGREARSRPTTGVDLTSGQGAGHTTHPHCQKPSGLTTPRAAGRCGSRGPQTRLRGGWYEHLRKRRGSLLRATRLRTLHISTSALEVPPGKSCESVQSGSARRDGWEVRPATHQRMNVCCRPGPGVRTRNVLQ